MERKKKVESRIKSRTFLDNKRDRAENVVVSKRQPCPFVDYSDGSTVEEIRVLIPIEEYAKP